MTEEQRFNEIFRVLEDNRKDISVKIGKLQDSLADFKVDVADRLGQMPCGSHAEIIEGVKDKQKLITAILVIVVSALIGIGIMQVK
jgi:hypothetical protein